MAFSFILSVTTSPYSQRFPSRTSQACQRATWHVACSCKVYSSVFFVSLYSISLVYQVDCAVISCYSVVAGGGFGRNCISEWDIVEASGAHIFHPPGGSSQEQSQRTVIFAVVECSVWFSYFGSSRSCSRIGRGVYRNTMTICYSYGGIC